MARFVVLFNWTDQGIKSAKDSVQRVEQAREAFKPLNVTIDSLYWTVGLYDLVGIVSAPDGETLSVALLKLGAAGNVRSTTMRAFDATEMAGILGRL
jgi:uncharacterized protein with GYD domain